MWTYAIKTIGGCKKAWCVCDGSTHLDMVRLLAETYANCVNQTSACLFYAIAAAKNLHIYGADVSNAFAKAPSPKYGFFIWPDCTFNKWWVNHKNVPPIPKGHMVPILSVMQGHPESPRLWEMHATRFYGRLVSHLWYMNPAYTQAPLMAIVSSSCDKSMILLSPHQMGKCPISSWTLSTIASRFW